MHRIQVNSNRLREIGYNRKRHVLEVLFANGKLYRFRGVQGPEYYRLLKASSKGRYLNYYIRPTHACEQIQ